MSLEINFIDYNKVTNTSDAFIACDELNCYVQYLSSTITTAPNIKKDKHTAGTTEDVHDFKIPDVKDKISPKKLKRINPFNKNHNEVVYLNKLRTDPDSIFPVVTKEIKTKEIDFAKAGLNQDQIDFLLALQNLRSGKIENDSKLLDIEQFQACKDKVENNFFDIGASMGVYSQFIAFNFNKVKNSKIIKQTRKLIPQDTGIIAKIENKSAIKNIKDIINTSDAIMVARGDLAVEIGANEVPHVQLDIVKKCSELGKPVIIATQMLESMIENNKPTRAEINDVGTAIFQGADVVMLSAETAVGKYPLQAVQAMKKTIVSTEKYKKENITLFKSNTKINNEPVKAIALAIKDIAYNIKVEAIIGFSVTGNTAKLISAIRPSAKIITISPHINISRQLSLLWGITSITNSDAKNWRQMMKISKEIIKSKKLTKIGGYAIITAGLPFGKSKMTNMIRLYQLGKN